MQAALATIWLCVAMGTGLGLSQRLGSRATDPIRSFAVVSAALVAIIVLLPHAVESEGLWGLAFGVGAFAAIPVVERLGTAVFRGLPTRTVRREVSFVGLLLHRFADGVAMRVEGHGADVLFALGAHEIPIVALVTLSYLDRGLGTALLRAALLGASSTLGCVAVDALPSALGDLHGYADALAAGILWHIVAHELSEPAAPPATRGLDVLGAAAAAVILWLPSAEEPSHGALAPVLLGWLLLSAPAAVIGLAAAAAVSAARAGRAAAPDPLPAVADVRVESVAVSFALLGWPLAALRLAGSGALTLAIGAVERRSVQGSSREAPSTLPATAASFAERWWEAARRGSAPLMVCLTLGAVVAAYVETFVPAGLLASRAWPHALAATAALAVVARSWPVAATPIAAALMAKGLSPSSALAGLWLGVATSATTLAALERALGAVRARWIAAGLTGAALALCAVLPVPAASGVTSSANSSFGWAFLAAGALLCAAGMLQTSVRGWLASGLGLQLRAAHAHAHDARSLPTATNVESSRSGNAASH